LFETHAEPVLKAWAQRLNSFRFVRARGGHANDGDGLELRLPYDGPGALQAFFHKAGIIPIVHPTRPPQMEKGLSYPGDTLRQFPSLIPGTEWMQQPGHCRIVGQQVFVWCTQKEIRISISSGYDVTEADVAAAEAVEAFLGDHLAGRIDPPVDDDHCICPKYYPDYFSSPR
jgi:hypothetical protein